MDERSIAKPSVGNGIALIGYRATGKTTVGRILAEWLDRPFIDCDSEIERRSGSTIRELFETRGEPAFRVWEERTLLEVTGESPSAVLATGGGSVLREINRKVLTNYGTVVWLVAPAAILTERLRCDPNPRPALTVAGLVDEVRSVLLAREPLYRSTAHWTVDASSSDPRSIAEEILRLWNTRTEEGGP